MQGELQAEADTARKLRVYKTPAQAKVEVQEEDGTKRKARCRQMQVQWAKRITGRISYSEQGEVQRVRRCVCERIRKKE